MLFRTVPWHSDLWLTTTQCYIYSHLLKKRSSSFKKKKKRENMQEFCILKLAHGLHLLGGYLFRLISHTFQMEVKVPRI